jgi:RNA polymerase subunit RPABC4/transcription elongation factor Spt4
MEIKMQLISCEKCGGDLTWDEDLCPKCLEALMQYQWDGLIQSLETKYTNEYTASAKQERSPYPEELEIVENDDQ